MKVRTLSVIPIFAGFLMAQDQVRTETRTTNTTWSGVLVDADCTRTERKETTNDPLNRTVTTVTETETCPVTPRTRTFGLVTRDGRYIRFDNPSNTRVVEIVRSNPAFAETNPVKVTAIGMANGDVAVVESLNPEVAVVQSQTMTRAGADTIFDAKYKGDRGKLLVTSTGLNFQDLEDADHSRSWTYTQIKELKREGNKIKIKPHNGDSAEFHLEGARMTEAVYQTIANRVVVARVK
jgi:hypothetical protein